MSQKERDVLKIMHAVLRGQRTVKEREVGYYPRSTEPQLFRQLRTAREATGTVTLI